MIRPRRGRFSVKHTSRLLPLIDEISFKPNCSRGDSRDAKIISNEISLLLFRSFSKRRVYRALQNCSFGRRERQCTDIVPPEKRKHRVGHLPLIFVRTNREVNEACREASSLFDSTFRSNNNWQPASILEQGEASVQRIESRIGTIQRIAPLNRVIF